MMSEVQGEVSTICEGSATSATISSAGVGGVGWWFYQVQSQCNQFQSPSAFHVLTSFMEMPISFSSKTQHTVPQLLPNGLLSMLLLQLDWPAHMPDLTWNLWATVNRKMRNTRPKNTHELRVAIKATWTSVYGPDYQR